MPQFGLSDATIAAIRHVFSQYPAVEKAVLYGSRAKGTQREGSDIDLTLLGEHLDARALSKMATQLEESAIPQQVDLSLWQHIELPALREHIARVGVVFYERAPDATAMHA